MTLVNVVACWPDERCFAHSQFDRMGTQDFQTKSASGWRANALQILLGSNCVFSDDSMSLITVHFLPSFTAPKYTPLEKLRILELQEGAAAGASFRLVSVDA